MFDRMKNPYNLHLHNVLSWGFASKLLFYLPKFLHLREFYDARIYILALLDEIKVRLDIIRSNQLASFFNLDSTLIYSYIR